MPEEGKQNVCVAQLSQQYWSQIEGIQAVAVLSYNIFFEINILLSYLNTEWFPSGGFVVVCLCGVFLSFFLFFSPHAICFLMFPPVIFIFCFLQSSLDVKHFL